MTQKAKPKGKSNPFASYMRPTEEILWQSKQGLDVWDALFPGANQTVVTLLISVIVGLGIGALLATLVTGQAIFITAFGTFILIMVALWVRMAFQGHLPFVPTQGDQAAYAITSERLFYQRGDDIRALPLEQVLSVSVMARTLNFGAAFPMWSHLDDAEQVKAVIERAQKERLKAMQK